jgi:hypothetical protein
MPYASAPATCVASLPPNWVRALWGTGRQVNAAAGKEPASDLLHRLTGERISPMPDVKQLLHSHLHEVFSERDPERRRAAIGRTYTEDVRLTDPEGEFVGWQALSDQAQKVLDGLPAAWAFEEDGPQYVGTDTAALAWRVGPPGRPKVRGIDILTIRDGRVSVLRTLLAGDTA